ncbi:thioredoxin family protein [Niabella beijingensis]|uniref:thioredoxin family protein n=1 Tax=Niabella beijingensis TaxID=2872700 RepID=UPI001CBADE90|nr:thioredoxin family protein [Niabella beijingensis]MBZ4190299.1 thioredoxin fold domain-containing protein [Niabella beijingensis]
MKLLQHTIPFILTGLLCCLQPEAQPMSRSFKQLDSLRQIHPKPIIIFVYTDWCRYCRAMEAVTFRNKKVATCLDRHFYFAMLNAEERRSIRFLDSSFRYRPTGIQSGEHELAAWLRNGQPAAYPALFILSSRGEPLLRTNSYLIPEDLIRLLEAVPKNDPTIHKAAAETNRAVPYGNH